VTARPLIVLLALGATWGASFLFIKVLVDETGPLEVAEGRLFLGALAVAAILAARRTRLPRRPSLWLRIVAWSLPGVVVPFILIAWAEEHIASGTAAVLNSTMPLFTAAFAAALLTEERFTTARALGLVAGFLGVVVLTGGDIYDLSDDSVLGQLAVVAAAACYGIGAVYARSLLREADPAALSAGQQAVGALMILPVLFAANGTPDYALSVEAWLSLLALGVLGTGIAIVAYLWLVDSIGAVRSSLVTYIIPIVGLLLGWAVLSESISVGTIFGSALIIAGVAAVMRGQAPTSQRAPLVAGAPAAD
jgi:drug/metabolite transporter (DMT)-like permease